MSIKLIPFFV